MPSLINMEMSKEEAKEYTEPKASEGPKYPWGLCLTLNDDSLKKLGIDKMPSVETEVTIIAKAVVSGTRENQTQGGDSQASIDLQITDMTLSTESDAASKLYSKTK
jgi:hypothetical protein